MDQHMILHAYTEDVYIQRLAPGQPVAVFYGPVFDEITDDGKWQF